MPSALIKGACPAGAVGSGRAAGFSRFGWASAAAGRAGRSASGRTTRVTGRATARRAGAAGFFAAAFGVAFAAVFAGADFLRSSSCCEDERLPVVSASTREIARGAVALAAAFAFASAFDDSPFFGTVALARVLAGAFFLAGITPSSP